MALGVPYRDDEDSAALLPFPNSPEFVNVVAEPSPPSHSRRFQIYTIAVTLGLIFLLDLSGNLMVAPTMRIMESILCYDYYKEANSTIIGDHGTVDEKYCKINIVQEGLAFLNGWDLFFSNLPGFFLAVPFGMMADKYGRKWLMVLGTTAILLRSLWSYVVFALPRIFPVRLMWLQAVFNIFGGGDVVLSTMIMVVTADVTPVSERATIFFYGHAMVFATSLLGVPMSSLLMDQDPWIPMNIGIVINIVSVLLVLVLPETISKSRQKGLSLDNQDQPTSIQHRRAESSTSIYSLHSTKSTSQLHEVESPSSPSSSVLSDIHPSPSMQPLLLFNSISSFASIFHAYSFLLHDWRIWFLIGLSSAQAITQVLDVLVLQYVPKRYNWSISQANYLSTLRATIGIITLLVFLPAASKFFLRRNGHDAFSKDILLCRISAALVTAGIVVNGLAPTISLFLLGLFVQMLGAGTSALIRSLSAGLVKDEEIARLYTAMSLVQTLIMVVAPPVIAGLFQEGMKKGGQWIGLPLLVGGLLFGVATGAMWALPFGAAAEAKRRTAVEEGDREG